MEREALIGVVEKKHHMRVHPNDPVFVLATIAEALMAESRAEQQRMQTEFLNQASALMAQTEAAAKARGEALLTQGGAWSAKQIKSAGEDVAGSIRNLVTLASEKTEANARTLRWGIVAAVVCSISALAVALAALGLVYAG